MLQAAERLRVLGAHHVAFWPESRAIVFALSVAGLSDQEIGLHRSIAVRSVRRLFSPDGRDKVACT